MRFLLLINDDPMEADLKPGDLDAAPWVAEHEGNGTRIGGGRVRPPQDARTVTVRDGKTLVAEGPYYDAVEKLGGFDIIECADLDAAVEVAAKHPIARFGKIEVRPFWE